MKSRLNRVGAAAGIAALAIVPSLFMASSAFAAATYVQTIATDLNQLDGHYSSTINPAGTIQAIPGYSRGSVTLVHLADHSAVEVADPDAVFSEPNYAAFSPDGATLYVSDYGTDLIVVIDVASATVVDTIQYNASEGVGIAVSPDGNTLVLTDDYDEVTSFDISNNYAVIANSDLNGNYGSAVYFTSNTSVLIAHDDGTLETFDTVTGAINVIGDVGDGTQSWCANADLSMLATSNGSNEALLIDPSDASVISTTVIVGAQTLTNCAFTGSGQVLFSDWDYTDGGDGIMWVVDQAGWELLDSVTVPAVDYTDAINVMRNCEVFIGGYYTNVGVVSLDSDWCTPRADDAAAPAAPAALASTGVNSDATLAAGLFAVAFMLAGAFGVAFATRRAAR